MFNQEPIAPDLLIKDTNIIFNSKSRKEKLNAKTNLVDHTKFKMGL